VQTYKSHISHVVVDTHFWEKQVTKELEDHAEVQSYARNDHMGFLIPYLAPDGVSRDHFPDFIVRLKSGLLIALEVKGKESEKDEFKKAAGEKWAKAVNNYFGERRWVYHVCYNPKSVAKEIDHFAASGSATSNAS
jgi:type III restriction enzyme